MSAAWADLVEAVRATLRADRLLVMVTAGGLAIVALCSLIIAKLLDDVMGGDDSARLDPVISDWVVAHRTDALTTVFRSVTHLADPMVVIAVAAVVGLWLVRVGWPRAALLVAASTLGAALMTTVAKLAVDRERPPRELWLGVASGPAFPSGHSAQSVALYGALAIVVILLVRSTVVRVAAVGMAVLIAALVGTSRVYLGVHWTSDVLCGWSIATLWLVTLVLAGWAVPRYRSGRVGHGPVDGRGQ